MRRFHYDVGWQKNGQVREVIRKVLRAKVAPNDVWGTIRKKLEMSKKGLLTWQRSQVNFTEDNIQEKSNVIHAL